MRTIPVFALLVALCAGCAPRADQAARAPLTERQRDSVLARSSLPGASTVGRALDASDRAAARASSLGAADSMFH